MCCLRGIREVLFYKANIQLKLCSCRLTQPHSSFPPLEENPTFMKRASVNLRLLLYLYVPQPGSKMVTSAKSSVPTVKDQAAAMQLGQCAKNLATCLAELRTAAQKVRTRRRGAASPRMTSSRFAHRPRRNKKINKPVALASLWKDNVQ